MKKVLAYSVSLLFMGLISLSVMAFIGDNPKKQKTETTTVTPAASPATTPAVTPAETPAAPDVAAETPCDQHKEAAKENKETKACCQEAGKTADGGCPKAAECKHHNASASEVK